MYSESGQKIMAFLKDQLKTELPKEDWDTIGYAITQYWGENTEEPDYTQDENERED